MQYNKGCERAGLFALLALLGVAVAAGPQTGKERLSDKASDEQRVDNCGVPADRRGSKPRPDCSRPAARETPDSARPVSGSERAPG
jgi:hypothetical protein